MSARVMVLVLGAFMLWCVAFAWARWGFVASLPLWFLAGLVAWIVWPMFHKVNAPCGWCGEPLREWETFMHDDCRKADEEAARASAEHEWIERQRR